MSMKEEWRFVSTRCGGLYAVGHPGTGTGELQMEELSADSWDTKNWVNLSYVVYLEVMSPG